MLNGGRQVGSFVGWRLTDATTATRTRCGGGELVNTIWSTYPSKPWSVRRLMVLIR